MTMRKGMMVGSGKSGYYNITGRDPMVHSLSARGIKQPQNITLWNRSQRSLPKNPTQNKESLTNLQIGQVFDLEKHPRYKVYASEKSFVIGGGKSDFTNWSDATLVQQWRAETHGTPRYYELLQELGRRRDKKSGLEKISQHQKVLGGKNLMLKERKVDNPYEIWRSADGTWEWRILKKWQEDDDKPYARWFCAVKSPMTFGSYDYGDVYVKDIKEFARKDEKKGGKIYFSTEGLQEPFTLSQENAIYVPSKDKNNNEISQKELDKRISETENFLSRLYGGFTRFDDYGGYKKLKGKNKGKIMKEHGARVASFASQEQMFSKNHNRRLKNFLLKKQKEWNQESMGYENQGELHYISAK